MKQQIRMILYFLLLLVLCGCSGSFTQVDLNDDIPIPENGIIKESVWEQIQKENAISIFTGKSNEFSYEWTIFGSDISEVRDINLLVDIEKLSDQEIQLTFHETGTLSFPALLSIHVDGSILNLSVKGDLKSRILRPDEQSDVQELSLSETDNTDSEITAGVSAEFPVDEDVEDSKQPDSYLSAVSDNSAQDGPIRSQTTTSVFVSETTANTEPTKTDQYLSNVKTGSSRVYSDGSRKEKDKYLTDPIPEGKPIPVEPEDQQVNEETTYTCTFSIECSTILNNLDDLDPDKLEMVPSDGKILKKTKVTFYEGESVYDVLQRICRENGIHMESSWTPIYNSAYIEGIHNLYEFDCGNLSGWMYRVNGWYPNYGCSRYQLAQGDVVEWRFTCDLGKDIGGGNLFK